MKEIEPRLKDSLKRWFILSAGFILLITGTAKLASAFGGPKVVYESDPIFGMTFHHLMIMAGLIEITIASACLFSKATKLNAGLIAWVATTFLLYRVGLMVLDWKRPCSCLGNLTDALHISPSAGDLMMKGLLAYLLVGGYIISFSYMRARHRGFPIVEALKAP